ncbi:MAG: hypothetical protein EPO24_03265 [Bacteroidetes bacterium]|nr:MAG: hypothetical protein EPO24_03265 [Bacteroidota bacterium]
MGKTADVDKAKRILPTNAVPGVVELNSNFTTYIAPVNPETAGEDTSSQECGSIDEVASTFKPKMEFEVKKLANLGAEKADETVTSIVMQYGKEGGVMSDFSAENLVVKAKTQEEERVLLDQQLAFQALEDLQERLKDPKVAQMLQNNRDGVLQSLAAEIEGIQKLLGDIKLESEM